MTHPATTRTLDALLDAPLSASAGHELIVWVRDLYVRIQRGEMMIGLLSVEDVQRAPDALRRAVDCGHNEAWLDLASWLTSPPFGDSDHPMAERAIRSAIEADLPTARLRLVEFRWFYQRDHATPQEGAEAVDVLRSLIHENAEDARALHLLGLLTCQGFGTEANPQEAFWLQRRAAALGHTDALFELYVHYASGLGVPRDDRAAFEAVEQAANAGHPRALYNMGAFHATGQHVPRDPRRAVEWYEKAFDAGNVRAAVNLAVMYATGDGVEVDREYAEQLFGQAEWLGFDASEAREAVGLTP